MRPNFILKVLALICVSVLPLQMYSNQSSKEGMVEEKQQVLPHVVHVGAGYSYIASQASLKNGGAVDFISMSNILFAWAKKWISL